MRWYVALTYNAGMVQVRSNNKYEALKFLEDNDYQVYYIETLNKYFNESNIKFLNGDFEKTVKNAKKGDFIYFDPPYAPISKTSNFTGYNESGFGENEQIRLKKLCDTLDKKGVKFLLSNSDCEFIRELYKDYNIVTIKAKRAINSNGNNRGNVSEVLIRNYE